MNDVNLVQGGHLSGRKADRGLQKEPIHAILDEIARQRVEKETHMMIRTGKYVCQTVVFHGSTHLV